jgi:hypothetical protein
MPHSSPLISHSEVDLKGPCAHRPQSLKRIRAVTRAYLGFGRERRQGDEDQARVWGCLAICSLHKMKF